MKPTFANDTEHVACKCERVVFRQKDEHPDPLFECIFCGHVIGSKSAIDAALAGEGSSGAFKLVPNADGE